MEELMKLLNFILEAAKELASRRGDAAVEEERVKMLISINEATELANQILTILESIK